MTELTLRPYQVNTLTRLIHNSRYLDRSHAGTGKTAPACVFTFYLVNTKQQRVIWLQPNSLLHKNKEELLAWTKLNSDQIQIVKGTPARKEKIINDPQVKIWLMSAESLGKYGAKMVQLYPNLLHIICDEPHLYYRGYTSKRTQSFINLVKKNPNIGVKFLTATPTPGGKLSSAFIYCDTIQPDYYRHYDYFMNYHAVMDDYGNPVDWVNHERLNKFLEHYSICHTKQEVYGDVPMFIIRDMIELSDKHEKFYRQFELEGILDLENSVLTGTSGGVASLRARQILNQPHKISLPSEWDAKGKPIKYKEAVLFDAKTKTAKEERLIEYFEEGEPLAIFAVFQDEQERLLHIGQSLGLRGALINGNVPMDKRAKIDLAFQKGELDFVVASPATAGVGFNWGFLNTIIYHSMAYGDDEFIQSYHRALRGMRTEPLRIVLLEYENTIEQTVLWKIHHNSRSSHKANKAAPVLVWPKPAADHSLRYADMTEEFFES